MIPIKDHKDFVRMGNAVVSSDNSAYAAHINKRKKQVEMENRISALEQKLENSMALILQQLQEIKDAK